MSARDAASWRKYLNDHLPPGAAIDTADGSLIDRLHGIYAQELARFDAMASALLAELDPRTTAALISDWERLMKIPRCDDDLPATLTLRRALVVAYLTRTQDLSPQTLIDAAAVHGYAITIQEYFPETVPGDAPDPDNRFRYHVTSTASELVLFRTGQSSAGDRLGVNEQTDLACLLNEIEPAYARRTGV